MRVVTKRKKGDYWKPGRGNFDSVELRYIPDVVGAHAGADLRPDRRRPTGSTPKTVSLVMRAPTVNVVRTKGTGNRFAWVALCDTDPYKSNDMRLALKYGIDRQKIIDNVYKGFATMGNDTTVAPSQKYYAKDLPQRPVRSRQGGVPLQEGRHGQRQSDAASLRRRLLRRDRRRRALSGGDEEGGHHARRQARLRRRLLEQCLVEGAVLRGLLGRPPDRGQSARADLPLQRQLERHALARPRVRQAAHARRAPNSTTPSAASFTPNARR